MSPGSIHPVNGRRYEETQPLLDYIRAAADVENCWNPMPLWIKSLLTQQTEIINGKVLEVERKSLPKEPVVEKAREIKTCSYVDEKFIAALVGMLNAERANGYESWARALWAIKNAGAEYGFDLRKLAHEFSKQTKRDNYDEDLCDVFYDKAKECKDEKLVGIASLRRWACEDSPAEYDTLCQSAIQSARGPAKIGYYEDLDDISSSTTATRAQIEDWMRSCIYQIRNGGKPFWHGAYT